MEGSLTVDSFDKSLLFSKNIWETPKLRLKVPELLIMPGPTTTPLILKTRQLLTRHLQNQKNIRSLAYHSDT